MHAGAGCRAYAFGIGSSFLCLLRLFVAIFRVLNK